jgi:uncharacterized membrane protein YhaH (DUF805 family)
MQVAIQTVFAKYAVFRGRASRPEYWYFFLLYSVLYVMCALLSELSSTLSGIGFLLMLVALLVPSISVGVRRLHDTNRSGWWLLLSFVPVVGTIVLLVFFCLEGTAGPNQYGPDPNEARADITAV